MHIHNLASRRALAWHAQGAKQLKARGSMELPLYLLLVDLRWDLGDPVRAALAARLGLAVDLSPLCQQFQDQ